MDRIPEPVLHADRVHHELLRRVAFSRHLNPVNAGAARLAFARGASAPPFEYTPLAEADELLSILDAVEPPRDHPAGELVGRCIDGTRLFLRALRDRTATAFHELAMSGDWYPRAPLLELRFDEAPPDDSPPVSPQRVMARLRAALQDRGLRSWQVVEDPVMSARVLVDGAKRLLRVNPISLYREHDLERLVAHEVDVHVVRADNGQRQVLRCFQTGLPGSLATEEGLALLTEERVGAGDPGSLARQQLVARAVDRGRDVGFRELYQELAEAHGEALAWGVCLRVKRGLRHPGRPGVYAKDSVYLAGRLQVEQWLRSGGDVAQLYVGKVGVSDPVGEWLQQGWARPGALPPPWAQAST